MIIEVAQIKIKPGMHDAFETAVSTAMGVFSRAEGCKGLHLQHCVEAPDEYEVIIRWDTLEAHTVTFREGPLFQEWRALVGPYFAEPPEVKHYTIGQRATFRDAP